jgi:hypothetical protein
VIYLSCDECDKAQNDANINCAYYYRWKNANIAIIGCREHVKEIIDFLNNKGDLNDTNRRRMV